MNSDRESLCVPAPGCVDGARRGSASCLHADGEPCGFFSDTASIPAAGEFWNVPAAVSGASAGSVSCVDGGSNGGGGGGCVGGPSSASACKSRAASVAYVLNSESGPAESAALQCLKDACDAAGCRMEVVHFGKLDFGEMAVLDQFYNAGESLSLEAVNAPCRHEPGPNPNFTEVHGAELLILPFFMTALTPVKPFELNIVFYTTVDFLQKKGRLKNLLSYFLKEKKKDRLHVKGAYWSFARISFFPPSN